LGNVPGGAFRSGFAAVIARAQTRRLLQGSASENPYLRQFDLMLISQGYAIERSIPEKASS
jgi:hypothetical protein